MHNGVFYLNDKPIYLRGNAINPPERGIPEQLEQSKEFARDYVRYMKSLHINIIRIPDNQNWMDDMRRRRNDDIRRSVRSS